VCVSDNCSTDNTEAVVSGAQRNIGIKYHKNHANLGRVKNYLNVVDMADGDFVWLVGDDDLLMPYALEELVELIDHHPDVDFYFINSFHLTTQYIATLPQPFDTANLPSEMVPFSSWRTSGEMMFMDLVDPKISFDFLGGMFLAVFRRELWEQNVSALDEAAISDTRDFSHFDNTFPHLKIFSKAFANAKAFFCAYPLSVCLAGDREWAPMSPLVYSVRLVEALDEYLKNGLSYLRYFKCKNYALRFFIPHLVKMYIYRDISGFNYIRPLRLILSNCLYPNFYLSIVYFVARKFGNSWTRLGYWYRSSSVK
jgi:glycosyltransferase involved in cell wall biosynthesis